jgi:beta-xylosidase
LTERPGHLRLYGNCYDLTSPESPALLLRKQAGYTETFRAKMNFNPSRLGYESGVTLWWNQYSFASIGVGIVEPSEGVEAVRTVIARGPTGKNGEPNVSYPLLDSRITFGADDAVQLTIDTTSTDYKLTQSAGEASASMSFPTETLTINPPVGCAFAGTMFGIYAFGKSEPALDPSDFWDIEIVERS